MTPTGQGAQSPAAFGPQLSSVQVKAVVAVAQTETPTPQ